MKRFLMSFICLCLCTGPFPITVATTPEWSPGVSIQADVDIVTDSGTRTVLHGKNMDQPYCPANITKILTALIMLEQCDPNEVVTFSHDDVYNVKAGSGSADINEEDVLTVQDYLYVLMLTSANKSANILACYVSGSREVFARLMNEKARSLGCTGSYFNNPSDLDDENYYIAAHDTAPIARTAIQNPEFLTISGTRSYQLAPTKWTPEGSYVANHHKMLNKNEAVYYPGAFVGKTGYTSLTGNTLVTCAKKNDITLIAVVLNSHQSHYSDTKALLGSGFRNFQSLRAVDYEIRYKSLKNDMTIAGMTPGGSIPLELDRSGRVVIPRGADFTDTQSALTYDLDGSRSQAAVACISYTYNDRPVGSVYLYFSGLEGGVTSPTSQGASGASAISIGQGGEADNPALSDPSDRPDAPGLQDTPEISSNAETPHGQTLAPAPAPRQDITSREGVTISTRIPANTLAILEIAFSLAVIIAIVATVKIHVRRKEEEDPYLRHQRGLERLENIDFSPSDFEKLVTQRRVPSSSLGERGKKGRGRRCKKSFFR